MKKKKKKKKERKKNAGQWQMFLNVATNSRVP